MSPAAPVRCVWVRPQSNPRSSRADEQLRTTADGVFAVGDVNGAPQFTDISYDDHRIVLDQLVGAGTRRTTDRVAVPTTTFLTPPLSRVGITEIQARQQARRDRGRKPVADIAAMPRPRILGETHGLIEVVVDAHTGLVLGATLFCVNSQELVNLVALPCAQASARPTCATGSGPTPRAPRPSTRVLAALS